MHWRAAYLSKSAAVWLTMLTHPPAWPLRRWLYENGLSLFVTFLVVLTLVGQLFTGWHEYNDDLRQMEMSPLSLGEYWQSGHFVEATFENWESEFLQMGLYVVLTIWLRQRGSSESKKLYENEDIDQDPDPRKPDAPGPVKRGGWRLKLYQNSLSLAFFLLFFGSVYLHALGGAEVYNIEQLHAGQPPVTVWGYLQTSRF